MAGGDYRVTTTTQGKERAVALLMQNQYTGAAPVSFRDYAAKVRSQSVRDFAVRPEEMVQAFEDLVLSEHIVKQIGTAAVSGTSIFLYGGTGTGKTVIAERIPRIYHDRVWIPHAVEVDGQIIAVFDPIVHELVEDPLHLAHDERWVTCKRPRVLVGGELTFEMLDLQFNPVAKYYSAPVQMKANNGVLIIDDFGRQRIRPDELLNRWILPLDRRIDFLTLAGGRKLEVPFDLFVVFATNLNPMDLADEAFLRRIHNKIKVDPMDPPSFKEIFKRLCIQHGLGYDSAVVDYLMDVLRSEFNQPLRACYARDVINQIRWGAQYDAREALVTKDSVLQACKNYFLTPAA
jgi:predicted ATPase with chaperone activity